MAWTYENGSPGGVSGIISWKGAWVTSTDYIVGDGVSNDGSSYVCKLAHTSAAATKPGTGASWTTYWDLIAQKGSTGSISGLSVETPSGAVNGVNTSFTVLNTPSFITINGLVQTEGEDYTIVGLAITTTNPPPTGSLIRSYYA